MAPKRSWASRRPPAPGPQDPELRLCVLGASLSGLAAIEALLEAWPAGGRRLVLHVFPELYDPVEPQHTYGTALKPWVDYVPERLGPARAEAFARRLEAWAEEGLVEEEPEGAVAELAGGAAKAAAKPGRRFRPRGGLHEMCSRYGRELAERKGQHAEVRIREESPWAIGFEGREEGWTVRLGERGPSERFGFLLLDYDFSMRLQHVKAVRELLDTGLPATEEVVACFGQLHSAKLIALAFTLEPPLQDAAPWSAALVRGQPALRWASRVEACGRLKWQRKGQEHWLAFSSSAFAKERFGPGWDKDAAGREVAQAFARACGVEAKRVKVLARPYHWDLPAARNRPVGELGLIADAERSIAWTGDWCLEPTAEGAFLSGQKAGRLLASALSTGRWPERAALLPQWRYIERREGDEDLASCALADDPLDSAYRGTCNWEACERLVAKRLPSLEGSDVLWLDHLPKGLQQSFAARRARGGDALPPALPAAGKRGLRVAIVGAGPAAFFCAERLAELAKSGELHLAPGPGALQLFRSRSKLSASQMETEHNTVFTREGAAFFDYGCQYLTAGGEWFRGKMRGYEAAGICHRWPVGVLSREAGFEELAKEQQGWAGVAGMWRFQEAVVETILKEQGPVLQAHHSVGIWPPKPGQRFPDNSPLMCETFRKNGDGSWTLENKKGETFGPFDVLVGSFASHHQLQAQLSAEPALRRLRDYLQQNLRFSPVITAMVTFGEPLGLAFNAAFVVGDERLAWMSNNNRKVGVGKRFEAEGRELWTFIAPAKYSHESFEKNGGGYKRRAFEDFLKAASELTGRDLWKHRPQLVRALHWEAGLPCTALPSRHGCLFDGDNGLGWCGHWATFGGVEGAALSGRSMAEVVAAFSRGEPAPEGAKYPEGTWPDIGAHTPEGSVRLGHGCFALQHPRLRSIDAPGEESSLALEDTAAFWGQHKAYGFGGEARSKGQDPNGRDVGKERREVARRWNRCAGG